MLLTSNHFSKLINREETGLAFYTFYRESDEEEQRGVGRPPIDINIEEVEFLPSLNLQWNRIAQILGISRHTLSSITK